MAQTAAPAAGAGAAAAATSAGATAPSPHAVAGSKDGLTPDWYWLYDTAGVTRAHIACVAKQIALAAAVPKPEGGLIKAAQDLGNPPRFRTRAGGRQERIIPEAHPAVRLAALKRILKEYHSATADATREASHHVALHPTDPMRWRVWVCGARGGLFDGAVVQCDVTFVERYPWTPFTLRLIQSTPNERAPERPRGDWQRAEKCETGFEHEMGFGLCCWNRDSEWSPALTASRVCALIASSTCAAKSGGGLHIWEVTHLCACDLPARITYESAAPAREWAAKSTRDAHFECDYSDVELQPKLREQCVLTALCGAHALAVATAKADAAAAASAAKAVAGATAHAATGAATPTPTPTPAYADADDIGAGLPVALGKIVAAYAAPNSLFGSLGALRLRAGCVPPRYPTKRLYPAVEDY